MKEKFYKIIDCLFIQSGYFETAIYILCTAVFVKIFLLVVEHIIVPAILAWCNM